MKYIILPFFWGSFGGKKNITGMVSAAGNCGNKSVFKKAALIFIIWSLLFSL